VKKIRHNSTYDPVTKSGRNLIAIFSSALLFHHQVERLENYNLKDMDTFYKFTNTRVLLPVKARHNNNKIALSD
jgi:hypothetical protein